MKIGILGQGKWGKTIKKLLAENGHEPLGFHHTDNTWEQQLDCLCIAIPVQHIRQTLHRFPNPECPVISLSKGLEITTGKRVTEIIKDVWKNENVGALSGPTFSEEILAGLPAAAVVSSEKEALGIFFQNIFHSRTFRVYRTTDLVGLELGGALKNVYAIAGGLCYGLALGENAHASLLTRSLAEMTRLGVAAGGKAETFFGLSGVGDLFLTASSMKSRNFRLGMRIASGIPLTKALSMESTVIEGYPTAFSVHKSALFSKQKKPVADEIYKILYEGKNIQASVMDLLRRQVGEED
ncbi:NAD(P)-dependent glycerol-3-phosphate dehydrogenase [Candidatus Methylacidiphilum fumarolicum]|uniref:Glycerol-3-phosphate dehydrogenase [NAD(P)+] n=2 Tax=Candidatus Methylacidiphilum fumarolicum TaxID=591154 RepID=I0JVM3_METFB|nr:NAD(P)H-dependent glycerol-3-phosphate dehydrogenase [Candidatus Methylacidiphilum fumarolicum]MBW6414048.1 NAD(P)-dependent glycerol-3-phosphate dehydrogenase [Candidatus Methylacidiphilum fumarolicum]TFE66395.1 NAD(FAD)-dependent dehydrogenase [Candidatus Methylacidiphilum fumarolicum]TFE75266.1 NAD(P)-dependent glycerol-3-phosphate dehydrogenase [Candidatus Methylacidiphilum fumarolicum]TFE76122.1 NAD(P)-dependent glycerol-3-phosphate dehydrogenase [Candidatus Methylacidiphilum fumarolicu